MPEKLFAPAVRFAAPAPAMPALVAASAATRALPERERARLADKFALWLAGVRLPHVARNPCGRVQCAGLFEARRCRPWCQSSARCAKASRWCTSTARAWPSRCLRAWTWR